jgi:hypothetical protein
MHNLEVQILPKSPKRHIFKKENDPTVMRQRPGAFVVLHMLMSHQEILESAIIEFQQPFS